MTKKFSVRRIKIFRWIGVMSVGCLVVVAALIRADRAAATAVSIDSTFGTNGRIINRIGTYSTLIHDITIQTDGKIVAVGEMENIVEPSVGPRAFVVIRYNSDGSLDTSFNGSGFVSSQFRNTGDYTTSIAYSTAIQADGKIVVAGYTNVVSRDIVYTDFAVARFDASGAFDNSFGNNGKAVIPLGRRRNYLNGMTIQPDGKIFLSGYNRDNETNLPTPVVARLNPNGALDATFSEDGIIAYQNDFFGSAKTALIQPDGKVVVIFDGTAIMIRLNANGSEDTSFGTNGRVFNTSHAPISGAFQPDGKIVLGGSRETPPGYSFVLSRFHPNGQLDVSFNNTGTVLFSFGNYRDFLKDIAVQPDGKIVAVGETDPSSGIDAVNFALARLNSNGSLDTTFDLDGKATVPVGDRSSSAHTVAVLSNGKILAAGIAGGFNLIRGDAALVRLMGDINTADFDGDTKTDISVFRPTTGAWYFLPSSGGLGAVNWGFGSDKIVPGDYTGDGRTDVAVFRPATGDWHVLRSESSTFYSVRFGSAEDVPVPADYDGDGKSDIAVFRPSNGFWYQLKSLDNQFFAQQFGQNGDLPQTGDYDGDARTDLAVFRSGNWYIFQSASQTFRAVSFGNSTDRPIPADFDGDGKTDVAVVRSDGAQNISNFYILRSSDNEFSRLIFGNSSDVPAVGDYDGDGKADISVFRPSNGAWYLNRSTAGFTGIQFGATGDRPIPGSYQ